MQGNVDVGSQNIVATRPFTITSNDSMIPLSIECWKPLLLLMAGADRLGFNSASYLLEGPYSQHSMIRNWTELN